MPLRRAIGCLVFALLAWTGCKDPEKKAAGDQCQQLAKACGDQEKHVEKVAAECAQAATKHAEKGCSAAALYDCYEKQLCGGEDKVWSLDDLRVLADRHDKCVAEREALRACVE